MTVEDLSKQIAIWKKGRTGLAFLVDDKDMSWRIPGSSW